ncbi:MAG: hypothetical protein CVT80_03430 [Alphaproteobacteria bacterium HGW-Alphaproteobacteria-2]|nr:MAG: hypothetical protein CVT80_03430 [Alphaproteobacteria bacterium HGW-Alphaproteobacteria-2]
MIIGLVLAAILVGSGAGAAALVAGHSVWMALALYAVTGIAWTLIGAAVLAIFGSGAGRGAAMPVAEARGG